MVGPAATIAILDRYYVRLQMLGIVVVAAAGLAIVSLFYSAWWSPGKRTIWDRVAGTQVRYRVTRRANPALLP